MNGTLLQTDRFGEYGSSSGRIRFTVGFEYDITLEEFKEFLASVKWYGYNPAGYGGPGAERYQNARGTTEPSSVWWYQCSQNCD